jgi:5-methyltetrahydropteroyltriglutamate--homocysteine methyltransferase
MFETTIAGSLPKPEWLAEPGKLWASWLLAGDQLAQGQRDAVLVALKEQETAGIDIVTDGEQSRQHFVHGFLEGIRGIDFGRRVSMGIRANRYTAEVPIVVGELRRERPVHLEHVRWARAHTRHRLKFTLPGPMTVVDTIADEYYGDRKRLAHAVAQIINAEAHELVAEGIDVLQLDEPAFNVYLQEVVDWGIDCLNEAIDSLGCRTAVHICYGYGIPANVAWKSTLGNEWRQYEHLFPLLAGSRVDQVSVECAGSRVPLGLLAMLRNKDVLMGCIDVATERVETAEEVAESIAAALEYVPAERLYPCTNCGMAPMARELAWRKLEALGAGAHLARARLGRRIGSFDEASAE